MFHWRASLRKRVTGDASTRIRDHFRKSGCKASGAGNDEDREEDTSFSGGGGDDQEDEVDWGDGDDYLGLGFRGLRSNSVTPVTTPAQAQPKAQAKPSISARPKYKLNERVLARTAGLQTYYPGKIGEVECASASAGAKRTYWVYFDDGDIDKHVPEANVRTEAEHEAATTQTHAEDAYCSDGDAPAGGFNAGGGSSGKQQGKAKAAAATARLPQEPEKRLRAVLALASGTTAAERGYLLRRLADNTSADWPVSLSIHTFDGGAFTVACTAGDTIPTVTRRIEANRASAGTIVPARRQRLFLTGSEDALGLGPDAGRTLRDCIGPAAAQRPAAAAARAPLALHLFLLFSDVPRPKNSVAKALSGDDARALEIHFMQPGVDVTAKLRGLRVERLLVFGTNKPSVGQFGCDTLGLLSYMGLKHVTGDTALHLAIRNDKFDCAELLAELGAGTDYGEMQNSEQKTASEMVAKALKMNSAAALMRLRSRLSASKAAAGAGRAGKASAKAAGGRPAAAAPAPARPSRRAAEFSSGDAGRRSSGQLTERYKSSLLAARSPGGSWDV
jgi:hypothetical protein